MASSDIYRLTRGREIKIVVIVKMPVYVGIVPPAGTMKAYGNTERQADD